MEEGNNLSTFYWRLHLALRAVGIEKQVKYKVDEEINETSEPPMGPIPCFHTP